ncbi:MAG: branched-chain amino acid transaminase [Sulfobacillus thermosulfidooxidans]|uniref:branched-chain amino acid transaminase n=1 Tax=Sulfobacillus TaxID=28033 RepID=UPI000CD14DBE|nr:branched-chain amino acid transaminase [Sulfobacillus sp. hq2]MCY0908423.1 branched-chain amino acid transaminase [Sulfobacillus thermotolerans]POB09107.1 branched chain amino acid aminotransferase [Sulfobacillus sp. hq2]PSR37762.1 MAG: branched-chain amino acid transaminase [Sulfobacillus thermosulfidooxidans]
MPLAYFHHRFLPLEEATVSIATHGLNYGTGCFEGIRAYHNREQDKLYIFRLREHYERFARSCQIMRIDPGHSVDEMMERTVQLLAQQNFHEDVYIRPLAFKADPVIKVTLEGIRDEFGVFAVPLGDYLPTSGIHVAVSSWRRLEDNAIPSRAKVTGSYVNTALAVTDAHLAGFDDAIFLTEAGHVAEGSAANFFMVREGMLITPDISENILEGITRQTIMQLAHDLGIPAASRTIDRSELYVADELFLVGTGVQISPITRIDHRMVGDGTIGKITQQLQSLYNQVVRGESDAYRSWLTPID